MPTFLSPGVYVKEIDFPVTGQNAGPVIPTFVGTATKGPLNTPTYCTSAQQAIDQFGEPTPDSYLLYAVLAFFEEGSACYIVRVGIECEDVQDEALDEVCIDTSGAKGSGWGRIPIYSGIDYGRIILREPTAANPFVFHAAGVDDIIYNDQDVSATDGATTATLDFTAGTAGSDAYTGCTDDSYLVLITGDPDDGEAITGATYEVVRNSDDAVVAHGTLTDDGTGTSDNIDVGDGLVFSIVVTSGRLEINDSFSFSAIPVNNSFSVSIEGAASVTATIANGTYSTVAAFVNAMNAVIPGGSDFAAAEYVDDDGNSYPQLLTDTAGERIQLLGTCAFANEVGVEQYAYDIPRGHLIGVNAGPYNFSSSNNRVNIDIIPQSNTAATTAIQFSIAAASGLDAATIAATIDANGTVNGVTYFDSFAITVPGGTSHVVIVTTASNPLSQLYLKANFSNIKTLRFAEQLGIGYPYTGSYTGFWDARPTLPTSGNEDASIPLSCEQSLTGAECALDTAYYSNIVGWFVAASPGTWINNYTISVAVQTSGVGNAAGRYQVTVYDTDGVVADTIQNVSFDKTDDRYIGNILNPGSKYGGQNGHEIINWDERPANLNNDPDEATFEVREPAVFNRRSFSGAADGIPSDPAYSYLLDGAVIGNAYDNTGIFSVQNTETYDISLLATPGFSSGAVIAQCLQLCQSRGDTIYFVDPPFGLRPQQIVDWHNGMLLSDLSAALNSSFGGLYWGWVKIYDQTNKQEVWIPPSGHVAAAYARSARVGYPWSAPAGLNRGRLTTVRDIEYNPSQGDLDLLYGSGNSVNSIVKFAKDGVVIYGQKTLYRADSPLNQIHIRLGLTYIRKNVIPTLRRFLWEPHDPTTWAIVRNTLNPLFADMAAGRGLDAYKIVCDESNNTPARRQAKQLWVSVFLKFTNVIEAVQLNLVLLQTTASFEIQEVLLAGGVVMGNQAN